MAFFGPRHENAAEQDAWTPRNDLAQIVADVVQRPTDESVEAQLADEEIAHLRGQT